MLISMLFVALTANSSDFAEYFQRKALQIIRIFTL